MLDRLYSGVTETRVIHRALWPWSLVLPVVWICWLCLQLPSALSRSVAAFVGPSAHAFAIVVACALPGAWLLIRRQGARAWSSILDTSPLVDAARSGLALLTWGVMWAGGYAVSIFTVCSIYGLSGGGGLTLRILTDFALALAPLAALAPAVATLHLPPTTSVLLWLATVMTSLAFGLPVPTIFTLSPQNATPGLAPALGASFLTTAAGLLLSAALAARRLSAVEHAHRNPRRHS